MGVSVGDGVGAMSTVRFGACVGLTVGRLVANGVEVLAGVGRGGGVEPEAGSVVSEPIGVGVSPGAAKALREARDAVVVLSGPRVESCIEARSRDSRCLGSSAVIAKRERPGEID